jgi:uncharacterized membrane protein YeaQ/YmgE (transglycosylase-associated protein family)
MLIGIVSWCICGALLGFIVSRLVDLHGDDPIFGIGVAAAGSLVGGCLYKFISGSTINIMNVRSLVWSVVASGVALAIWHVIRALSPHEQQTIRRSY